MQEVFQGVPLNEFGREALHIPSLAAREQPKWIVRTLHVPANERLKGRYPFPNLVHLGSYFRFQGCKIGHLLGGFGHDLIGQAGAHLIYCLSTTSLPLHYLLTYLLLHHSGSISINNYLTV